MGIKKHALENVFTIHYYSKKIFLEPFDDPLEKASF